MAQCPTRTWQHNAGLGRFLWQGDRCYVSHGISFTLQRDTMRIGKKLCRVSKFQTCREETIRPRPPPTDSNTLPGCVSISCTFPIIGHHAHVYMNDRSHTSQDDQTAKNTTCHETADYSDIASELPCSCFLCTILRLCSKVPNGMPSQAFPKACCCCACCCCCSLLSRRCGHCMAETWSWTHA